MVSPSISVSLLFQNEHIIKAMQFCFVKNGRVKRIHKREGANGFILFLLRNAY